MSKQVGNRILSKNDMASNDTWATGLNNNDLIIGPTGAGKTRSYVKPNILQMNESMIITDTKGLLSTEVGPVLRSHGYEVIDIDLTDPAAGCGYNPLDFIKEDSCGNPRSIDIARIAKALCPDETLQDPFWDHAAANLLCALLAFLVEYYPSDNRNLVDVLRLAPGLMDGRVDDIMHMHHNRHSDSLAYRKWVSFYSGNASEKTLGSIVSIMTNKLEPLSFADTETMFRKDHRISFKDIGLKKTAVFLTVSDTDRSLDRLAGLFYMQALQELVSFADNECGGALPVPVRFYLDDFATNCKIEDFDKTISIIRSRHIAVSVILQSITQLQTLYTEPQATTIINGCDHLLYLGGQDIATAEFVSKKANKSLHTILGQPVSDAWLFRRGAEGKLVEKFSLQDHPLYCELPEANPYTEFYFLDEQGIDSETRLTAA